jgi:hypothetical protein
MGPQYLAAELTIRMAKRVSLKHELPAVYADWANRRDTQCDTISSDIHSSLMPQLMDFAFVNR